jgi:plastocyanin
MLPLLNKNIARIVIAATILSFMHIMLLTTSFVPALAAPSSRIWHIQVGSASADQSIQGMVFLPGTLWINQGDTVVWTAKAGEIHTVTFLKPGQKEPAFSDSDPQQTQLQGGHAYDGTSYFNSGLLSNPPTHHAATTYSLTFNVVGDFTYYCLVHPAMLGLIHVRPAGTGYPFSQQDYDQQASKMAATILLDGHHLAQEAQQQSSSHYIIDGIGQGSTTVMRFFPQNTVIHVGDTITFVNTDSMEPHTVTFGAEQPDNSVPYGDPTAFNGTSPLNSGFIGADPHWFGTTFKVKFTKAGRFAFRCELHDYMGMLETIVVLPE